MQTLAEHGAQLRKSFTTTPERATSSYMGKFYRGRGEGFTKKVDISHLFRIGKATKWLRKLGEQMQSEPILKEVEEIEYALAVIDEQVKDFDLKQYLMPEDEPTVGYRKAVKLPTRNRVQSKTKSLF